MEVSSLANASLSDGVSRTQESQFCVFMPPPNMLVAKKLTFMQFKLLCFLFFIVTWENPVENRELECLTFWCLLYIVVMMILIGSFIIVYIF